MGAPVAAKARPRPSHLASALCRRNGPAVGAMWKPRYGPESKMPNRVHSSTRFASQERMRCTSVRPEPNGAFGHGDRPAYVHHAPLESTSLLRVFV